MTCSDTQTQSLSLRISITDKCEFRCLYCMPSQGAPQLKHEDILSFEQIADFISMAKSEFDLRKVHLTGGEPLIKRGIEILIRYLKDIEGLQEVAMTTNGTLLADKAQR